MKRIWLKLATVLTMAMILSACGGGGGGAGGPDDVQLPQPIGDMYVMDGLVDLSTMSNARSMTVELREMTLGNPVAKTSHLEWAMANDDRYLYVAMTWTDDTFNHQYDPTHGPLDYDGVQLLFDNDGDGYFERHEDKRTVVAASTGSLFSDEYTVPTGPDGIDPEKNGTARLRYDAAHQRYQAEFMIRLVDDSHYHDGVLNDQSRYSIVLFDHYQPGNPDIGNRGSTWGMGPSSTAWDNIAYRETGPHAYPKMPSDLTGTIVYLSSHETSKREIYILDLADDISQRIDTDISLYKDEVSLSYNRQAVSFCATPDVTDPDNFEIYAVNVDGSGLTRLTSNSIQDRHPSWSPNGGRIAYASYRDGGQASIVIMSTDGTEIADLTPPGNHDTDPSYLADGRIMFKTDRFSTFPQLRIAVMDEDGTNVAPVTATAGVSDHHPSGDGTWCLFERFNKATDPAADPEAPFTSWDIIEAKLDGSEERILVEDGWVNWRPVYSPDGRYILYLKNQPYTTMHLMTRKGEDLGMMRHWLTWIDYIDWK